MGELTVIPGRRGDGQEERRWGMSGERWRGRGRRRRQGRNKLEGENIEGVKRKQGHRSMKKRRRCRV